MPGTYKQLSFGERFIIQNQLSNPDITLKMIANTLNRSPKAIRYEITHHLKVIIRANAHIISVADKIHVIAQGYVPTV